MFYFRTSALVETLISHGNGITQQILSIYSVYQEGVEKGLCDQTDGLLAHFRTGTGSKRRK